MRKNLRSEVFERDQGICARCGLDTVALAIALQEIAESCSVSSRAVILFAIGRRAGKQRNGDGALWEADHIKAWTEDGPDSLENLRTLCLECHYDETAFLRSRLRSPLGSLVDHRIGNIVFSESDLLDDLASVEDVVRTHQDEYRRTRHEQSQMEEDPECFEPAGSDPIVQYPNWPVLVDAIPEEISEFAMQMMARY